MEAGQLPDSAEAGARPTFRAAKRDHGLAFGRDPDPQERPEVRFLHDQTEFCSAARQLVPNVNPCSVRGGIPGSVSHFVVALASHAGDRWRVYVETEDGPLSSVPAVLAPFYAPDRVADCVLCEVAGPVDIAPARLCADFLARVQPSSAREKLVQSNANPKCSRAVMDGGDYVWVLVLDVPPEVVAALGGVSDTPLVSASATVESAEARLVPSPFVMELLANVKPWAVPYLRQADLLSREEGRALLQPQGDMVHRARGHP